ncbi:MAG TPA: D-aminoacyl-tRNA deacylase [Tenuifilaceae bacterium]|nr:D-aminoacyl-tRNA deacylase [Tenuifilaceae bacterium]HOZ13629.1 D-aminoacyl-tRNA deacylase [Tenuifilaceae bacterium]HPI43606.1 D-aminoacyl-tRNA deacylase [Tenuifilaceae bacterium]HPN21788.1 D-aminoacyl-tRNA deacylase [Tenuifilaceae bacterium]HPV55771.1 D-aminoacyl-tRNA deacylase [Tenuifilaceae bacterium]
MRVVIQRVSSSKVDIDGKTVGSIGLGLLVLSGFESADTQEDLEWTAAKITKLRIFDDNEGVMNLSVTDVNGDILAVSQFTLHAKTKKGNRPSYIQAAPPDIAIPLYENFVKILETEINKKVQTGKFGANMAVLLVNDGPVTIIIDSKNRE